MFTKRTLIFIFIVFNFALGQGSEKYQMPGKGVILGEVIHADTGSPIEYASISLINQKSNEVVTGQLTDGRGVFVLQEIKKGYYFIEVSFMGFESWRSEEIHITKTNNRNNLGIIKLQSKLLEGTEVNIT